MSETSGETGPLITDGRQSDTALMIQRGVMRMLRGRFDFCCFAEVALANSRRADVLAVGPRGEIWIVEIKSSLADFRADGKWHHYRDFCDRFYFAKPPELDADIFPETEGLLVADGHGAEVLRDAPADNLAPARRKAMMLKLVRLGADRVHGLMDPGPR
ncbi:MmcB family DNA repair protein [Cucumibacter marinus]|uniref:MmcB family DNA repair protein n=1 Tax=Cucumibacter marinus TaxID=1121252 RepID=UPI0004906E37|nr:MmcB family DNA repair protein [Cucumibacter marinus]